MHLSQSSGTLIPVEDCSKFICYFEDAPLSYFPPSLCAGAGFSFSRFRKILWMLLCYHFERERKGGKKHVNTVELILLVVLNSFQIRMIFPDFYRLAQSSCIFYMLIWVLFLFPLGFKVIIIVALQKPNRWWLLLQEYTERNWLSLNLLIHFIIISIWSH